MSNERTFIQEIKNSANKYEIFYYKIPDSPYIGPETRFQPKKPFDLFLIKDGEFVAIEAKYCKGNERFPFKNVKEHQIAGLLDVERHGCKAYIMINFRGEGIIDTKAIRILDFLALVKSSKYRSMSVDETRYITNIKWYGRGIWGIDVLFDGEQKGL